MRAVLDPELEIRNGLRKGVFDMSETISIIGKRIRSFRCEQHLSQEELAEKADLHYTYIGQVERGEKNITIGSLEKICNALDVTFEDVFKGIGSSDANSEISRSILEIIYDKPAETQSIYLNIIRELSKL